MGMFVNERRMQEKMVTNYFDTVWCIAASRWVKWFVIGYTSKSGKERFSAYKTKGYNNMVVLADRLTQKQALELEEQLQNLCKAGKPGQLVYKRKYHPEHRDLRYSRSSGQGSPDPCAPIHSVYMAWVQPE